MMRTEPSEPAAHPSAEAAIRGADQIVLGPGSLFTSLIATVLVPVYEGTAVGAELPAAVELQVTDTEPGVKGDRVSGALKAATLETGAVVSVPLFVERGERIKVDTRSGEYISRA